MENVGLVVVVLIVAALVGWWVSDKGSEWMESHFVAGMVVFLIGGIIVIFALRAPTALVHNVPHP